MTSVAYEPRVTGRATAGIRLGILTLDTGHELVPGNVQNAASFDFPVTYAIVRNVPFPALMRGDDAALPAIMIGVEELQSSGVNVIAGACGSFGHYQKAVASIAKVPVCLSILVQTPWILSLLPKTRKLGIVFARTAAFTDKVREQCDIAEPDRIVAVGADQLASFSPILDPRMPFDHELLRKDLVILLQQTQSSHPSIAAWLLQCSDLPPYARSIARATGLPVFDMSILIRHLRQALVPPDYSGVW